MIGRKTLTFRWGQTWVEVRPLAGRLAEVLSGNCFSVDEIVERPEGISWETAGGNTLLSPSRLTTTYVPFPDWAFRPEAAPDGARDPTIVDSARARPAVSGVEPPAAA